MPYDFFLYDHPSGTMFGIRDFVMDYDREKDALSWYQVVPEMQKTVDNLHRMAHTIEKQMKLIEHLDPKAIGDAIDRIRDAAKAEDEYALAMYQAEHDMPGTYVPVAKHYLDVAVGKIQENDFYIYNHIVDWGCPIKV